MGYNQGHVQVVHTPLDGANEEPGDREDPRALRRAPGMAPHAERDVPVSCQRTAQRQRRARSCERVLDLPGPTRLELMPGQTGGPPPLTGLRVLAPRMGRSTNWRGVAEPQVWFRIVHVASDGHHRSLGDAIREQTAEIALGPKGAFKNCNVGSVRRQVAPDQVVNALPEPRGRPKPPRQPRTPRVVELLSKALVWQALLESGEVKNQAEIARREGITRARVTQVMGMLRLAPEIQEHILALPCTVRRPAISERALRPIAQLDNPMDQRAQFDQLIEQA